MTKVITDETEYIIHEMYKELYPLIDGAENSLFFILSPEEYDKLRINESEGLESQMIAYLLFPEILEGFR
jgi:hypothetical protein